MDDSIQKKICKFYEAFSMKTRGMCLIYKILLIIDYVLGRIFFKRTMTDYFQYKFYEKSIYGRGKYITWGKMRKFVSKVNSREASSIFREKNKFMVTFKEYTGRRSIDLQTATEKELTSLFFNNDKLFIKPIDGSWGVGVEIWDCKKKNLQDFYKEYSGKAVMVEEVIHQHPLLAEFNETSTNSIRLVTFLHKNGEVELLPGAAIRLGRKGKIADNFHHMGIGAYIDENAGIIISCGIDKDGNSYIYHPDSNKLIIGFKIPCWEKICDTVKKAALVVPTVRYVGWDITVTPSEEIIIIEGNDKADPDIGQMSMNRGNWIKYKQCMNEK